MEQEDRTAQPEFLRKHSYLSGNFAPVSKTHRLVPCHYIGDIPEELGGGQYVRNGSNPVLNNNVSRLAHWFDGDGLLTGVYFRLLPNRNTIQPEFVSEFAVTDVYLTAIANPDLNDPITLSIATFLNPKTTVTGIVGDLWRMVRTIARSYLGGTTLPIKRISVANTNIVYHDGRALAMCESGPPLRVSLPDLRTVGWFNGIFAEGELTGSTVGRGIGRSGFFRLFREMTTAHPRVDPHTNELILFHSTYVAPYVTYSVIAGNGPSQAASANLFNSPIPGVCSAKVMHDFGVSRSHTVIIDLPITLSLTNLLRQKSILEYHPGAQTRFGIFPRHAPDQIRWFETAACCIFHTVNSWDTTDEDPLAHNRSCSVEYVNMLVCRTNHPAFIFTAADLEPIPSINDEQRSNLQSRLYYYQFRLDMPWNSISKQWALSAIPFEFPHLPRHLSGSRMHYVYGCSTSLGSFGIAVGSPAKIDCLVKVDAHCLIETGLQHPPVEVTGCVDNRDIHELLRGGHSDDPIQVFRMKPGWYAQECSFVPRRSATSEDDGFLLTFVFDESQLNKHGDAPEEAISELWILDAKSMQGVVGRVLLPYRVPYGIHGNWFTKSEVENQQPIAAHRIAERSPSLAR